MIIAYSITTKTKPPKFNKKYSRACCFGFNGQEKDNEVAGEGNSYTAEFWHYDTRLGRRFNLDPVDQISISNYAAFRNNPIIFIDPLGDEVVNGDQLDANAKKSERDGRADVRKDFMKNLKIDETTTKKDFLKNGGNEDDWKTYESLTDEVKQLTKDYEVFQARADITAETIKKWAESSPKIFAEANNQNVDMILISRDLSKEEYYGKNEIYTSSDGITFMTPRFPFYNKPCIVVVADFNVNITSKDQETGGFTLNHEAGHFVYLVNNPSNYYHYMQLLTKQGRSLNGGHNDDDESGKNAKQYENKIDCDN